MLSSDTNNPREDSVFLRVKRAVRLNGGPGNTVDFLRRYRELENIQQARSLKGLTHKDFVAFLREFGVRLKDHEATYLCTAFDDDQDGFISSGTFVRHFTGLNLRRYKAVLRAWDALPKDKHDEVAVAELSNRYALHGTRNDFNATFVTSVDSAGTARHEGIASWEEFLAYYAAVSAEIPIDEQFEVYMLREWVADAPTHPTLDETHRDWGEGSDPLAINGPLFVQDALKRDLGLSSRSYNYTHMKRVHPYVEPLPPLEKDYMSITKRDFRPYSGDEIVTTNTLRHRSVELIKRVCIVRPIMKIAENTARILTNIPLPNEVSVIHRHAAVIDIGSSTTRVGFAGDDAPRIDKPTCVVKDNNELGGKSKLALSEAYDARDRATIHRVMEKGQVIDWEAMENLLQHIADLLHIGTHDIHTPLLLTEKALVPRVQRQRLAEILIEKHAVDALHFSASPVLALYSQGLPTGLSVEMGNDVSHVVPVFQGYSLFHAIHAIPIGGRTGTEYMMRTGQPLPDIVNPHHHFDVWQYIKEKYCETAPDSATFCRTFEAEKNDDNHSDVVEHHLPDGTTISLGPNRYVPAEMFFDPTLLSDYKSRMEQVPMQFEEQLHTSATPCGLHELIVESVKKCDADLTRSFYDSILFSGGGSLLRSLPERAALDLVGLIGEHPNVIAPTERRHSAFVGGSILASLPTFQDFWVTKAEYEESGVFAVHQRCF